MRGALSTSEYQEFQVTSDEEVFEPLFSDMKTDGSEFEVSKDKKQKFELRTRAKCDNKLSDMKGEIEKANLNIRLLFQIE